MHLNNIQCFRKCILHNKSIGKKNIWLASTGKVEKPTRVNLGGGCLFVPDDEVKDFLARDLKYALIDRKEVNLTEQPLILEDGSSYSPVVIDVDLRYSTGNVKS